MKKRLLTLSWIFFLLQPPAFMQELKLLLDTLVEADRVQLDPLGNIYVLDQTNKTLHKFDPEFNHLYKISFQNYWNAARMDVSDPFKIILYYPGDFKIHLLDAQLSLMQTVEEAALNEQTVLCHYDSDRFIIFDGNKLYIKNYKTGKIEYSTYSGLHFEANPKDVSIKKIKNKIYYIRKNMGVFAYTTQLFEDKKWSDPGAEMTEITDRSFYKIKNNIIFGFDINDHTESKLYTANHDIKSFSVVNQKMALLAGNRLKLWALY